MAVREVLLDVGDGSLTLDHLTPTEHLPDVDDATGGFAFIAITPTRLRRGHVTPTTVFAQSMYTGLIRGVRRERGRTEVAFCSPLVLSGDEDSKGDNPIDTSGGGSITTRPFWNGIGNTSVVEAWRTRAQGLTVHSSVPTAASPTVSYSVDEGATGLEILRRGCRGAFATWREFYLDPQLALHADVNTNLFRAGHAVVTPWFEGPLDGDRWGLPARLVDDADVEDYTTDVVVNNGGSIQGSATVGSTPYLAPDGDALVMQRTIQSNAPPNNTGATRVASTQLGRFDDAKHSLTVRTDSRLARLHVQPGDWVHCCDPDVGVVDPAGATQVGGKVLPLVTGVRAQAVRWNVEDGQGVYRLHRITSPSPGWQVTDWSSYFVPEEPGCEIEVGDLTRTLGYQPLAKAVA